MRLFTFFRACNCTPDSDFHKLLFIALTAGMLLVSAAHAQLNIGDGALFYCQNQTLFSVKKNVAVSKGKVIKKFRRIIQRKSIAVSKARKGSKRRRNAVAARKLAKQGIREAKSCIKGTFAGSIIDTWLLVTENGLTPAEAGFTSLTNIFTGSSFTSTLLGPVSCVWRGTYTESSTAITVNTVMATGGVTCDQAVGASRAATRTLSADGTTLTLDYTASGGTLQVFMRSS